MDEKPAGAYSPSPYTSLVNPPPRGSYPESPELGHHRSQDMTTGYQYSLAAGAVNGDNNNNYGAAGGSPIHTNIVIVGGCPACRVGVLDDHFTCLGILCAIFLFPIGIICCLGSRQRRCNNCGAVFG